jgi:hypothetical protein
MRSSVAAELSGQSVRALSCAIGSGPTRARADTSCKTETVPRQRSGGGGGAPRMSSKEAVLAELDGASRRDDTGSSSSAIDILRDAPAALQADREVVLAAVAKSYHALYYAAAALKADREVVLAAVAKNGQRGM